MVCHLGFWLRQFSYLMPKVQMPHLVASGVVTLVAAVSLPVWGFGFILGDDFVHLHSHAAPFYEVYKKVFMPVTYVFYDVTKALFGLDTARPYHALNWFFHVGNTALVFFLTKRILGNLVAATLAAAVFGLHPLQVEAVAWISGFKEVLSAFWFLSAFYCFIEQQHRPRLAYATLALCALAFFTKSTTVFLPALFILWNRRQAWWFWAVLGGLIACTIAVAVMLQTDLGYSAEQASLLQRPILVLDSLSFYLSRFVLPQRLSIDLARPPSAVVENLSALMLFAEALFFAGAAYLLSTAKLPLIGKLGAALFLLALFPVLGALPFVHQHISTVASRYAYLAVLGGAWILVATLSAKPAYAGASLWIAFLIFQTHSILPTWKNDRSVFEYSVQQNPGGWFSHFQLAQWEQSSGQTDAALEHYRLSAQNAPSRPEPRLAVARLLRDRGARETALAEYRSLCEDFPGLLNAKWELSQLLETPP